MTGYTLAVDDLVLLFLKHAARYYVKNGEQTNEVNNTVNAWVSETSSLADTINELSQVNL